jgi:hypothetical protein
MIGSGKEEKQRMVPAASMATHLPDIGAAP